MLPGIRLKELAVAVQSSDDSYMPRVMAVSVGDSPTLLKEVRQHNIPRSVFLFLLSEQFFYCQQTNFVMNE